MVDPMKVFENDLKQIINRIPYDIPYSIKDEGAQEMDGLENAIKQFYFSGTTLIAEPYYNGITLDLYLVNSFHESFFVDSHGRGVYHPYHYALLALFDELHKSIDWSKYDIHTIIYKVVVWPINWFGASLWPGMHSIFSLRDDDCLPIKKTNFIIRYASVDNIKMSNAFLEYNNLVDRYSKDYIRDKYAFTELEMKSFDKILIPEFPIEGIYDQSEIERYRIVIEGVRQGCISELIKVIYIKGEDRSDSNDWNAPSIYKNNKYPIIPRNSFNKSDYSIIIDQMRNYLNSFNNNWLVGGIIVKPEVKPAIESQLVPAVIVRNESQVKLDYGLDYINIGLKELINNKNDIDSFITLSSQYSVSTRMIRECQSNVSKLASFDKHRIVMATLKKSVEKHYY